jgi:hypothetical protein
MASALVGLLSPACAASPVFRFGNAGDIVVCNCAQPGKDKSMMVNEEASTRSMRFWPDGSLGIYLLGFLGE